MQRRSRLSVMHGTTSRKTPSVFRAAVPVGAVVGVLALPGHTAAALACPEPVEGPKRRAAGSCLRKASRHLNRPVTPTNACHRTFCATTQAREHPNHPPCALALRQAQDRRARLQITSLAAKNIFHYTPPVTIRPPTNHTPPTREMPPLR